MLTEAKRERMKEEAIERLSMLDLHPNVLEDFERGVVNYSERTLLGGILYWLSNKPDWEKKVREIEKEYGILVYHITHESTVEYGEWLTCLYVSSTESKWYLNKKDLRKKNGVFYPYAYIINLTFPDYSEFSSVAMKEMSGGLIRLA